MTPGQYAAHRGVDLKSVKQAVEEGRLAGAVAEDGTITSAEAADAAWAKNTRPRSGGPGPGAGNGHDADPTLAAAVRRRTEASCADLEDELAALRAGCAAPVDVQRWMREELGPVVERIRAIPSRVAGLDGEIHRALLEQSTVEEAPPVAPRPRSRPATAAALAAYRTSLLAERAEYTTALRRGEVVKIEDVADELADRLTACRSLLLNLSAVAVTDADVPAQIELVVRELTTLPGEILYDELEAPRANGHDRKVTAKRTAPVRQKKAAKVAPTQRWQTLGEQMARYNELVEVAIGLGLTRFCRRGLNGTTFATRAAGDAATAKITTAIAAARRAP